MGNLRSFEGCGGRSDETFVPPKRPYSQTRMIHGGCCCNRAFAAVTHRGVKPVLDASGSGHSVVAEAFLGVSEENATALEAERLFYAVRTRVVSTSQKLNAEQIPTYDPIHMAGHESLSDFIFVPLAL